MGACFGHCLNAITDCFFRRSYLQHTSILVNEDEQVELRQSIDTTFMHHMNHSSSPKRLLSLFSLKKLKKTFKVPVAFELIENTDWPRKQRNYKKFANENASRSSGLDNPLQVLDASGLLLNQECVSFTPTSSIDLEWENEGMPAPIENNKSQNLDEFLSDDTRDNSRPSSLTASPWSRISTPNSLEWDPVAADNEDFETDNLLTEIERLTNRALDETAEWVNSS